MTETLLVYFYFQLRMCFSVDAEEANGVCDKLGVRCKILSLFMWLLDTSAHAEHPILVKHS